VRPFVVLSELHSPRHIWREFSLACSIIKLFSMCRYFCFYCHTQIGRDTLASFCPMDIDAFTSRIKTLDTKPRAITSRQLSASCSYRTLRRVSVAGWVSLNTQVRTYFRDLPIAWSSLQQSSRKFAESLYLEYTPRTRVGEVAALVRRMCSFICWWAMLNCVASILTPSYARTDLFSVTSQRDVM
jgi:hypothetical protein